MSPRRGGLWKRAAEPGSFASTATGIFLAYGAPTVAALGLLGLISGDRLIAGPMFLLGAALTVFGHRIAGR
jgi:hypothetical protein